MVITLRWPASYITLPIGKQGCQLVNEVRQMFGAHSARVISFAPAFGTISSVLVSRATLAIAITTPECTVPMEPTGPNDGWCDDPAEADYNRMIRLPHDGHYEELWRQDAVYDLIGVLGWNDNPVQRDRGSAIFLHVARPDYAPTEGCIALGLGDLQRVLAAGIGEVLVLPPR